MRWVKGIIVISRMNAIPNVAHLTPFQNVKNELDPSADLRWRYKKSGKHKQVIINHNSLSSSENASRITIIDFQG